jgi:tetratricopeptide (TPR) repeat protein
VIARNEAANLAACLGPLVPLVSEMIVVDTGSADSTRSIAESFGAHVFDFPWCDDFAAARNESLRRATGEWILWMDADDRLDAVNLGKLGELLRGLDANRVAGLMSCMSLASDGQATFEVKHVRLFPSAPAHRWRGRVHEQILPALHATGCQLRETGIAVHHVGYQDQALFLRKLERNLRLLELEYERRPPDGWYFFQRGGAHLDLGRYAEAIVSLHIAVPLVSPDLSVRVHAMLGEAYAHEHRLDLALEMVREGLLVAVSAPQLWLLEAEILGAIGDYDASELSAMTALGHGNDPASLGVLDTTVAFRSRHLLAHLAGMRGQMDLCERHARAVLAVRPAFGPALLVLAEALLAQGNIEAFDALAGTIAASPETPTAQALLGAMKAAHFGDRGGGLEILAKALVRDGKSLFLAKARALALVAAAHPDAATALEDLLRRAPLDLEARAAHRRLHGASPVLRSSAARF